MSLYSWLVREKPRLGGRCYKVPSLAAGLPDLHKASSEEAAPDCQSANDKIEAKLEKSMVGKKWRRTGYGNYSAEPRMRMAKMAYEYGLLAAAKKMSEDQTQQESFIHHYPVNSL